ncbi:hypothetical protein CYMTET_18747 [Cymbomonas tetramitiformis]|uniref:DNA excision repair protein ERCC-6-like n=1 Tax=Cymbomonas tetramitiformis TaxID=36881 RepID=A0AAE0L5V9_9CHLO|nr:hypothetical protein CYMTET_18747 [Cymbomonas tetramitiformis]
MDSALKSSESLRKPGVPSRKTHTDTDELIKDIDKLHLDSKSGATIAQVEKKINDMSALSSPETSDRCQVPASTKDQQQPQFVSKRTVCNSTDSEDSESDELNHSESSDVSDVESNPDETSDDREAEDPEPEYASDTELEPLELKEGHHRFLLSGRIVKRLYSHQREGVRWLWGLHTTSRGGILGDDMGLGKTFQCCSFLAGLFAAGAIKSALIVAPKTLLVQWGKELALCGLRGKTHQFYGGSVDDRTEALRRVVEHGGVLLTTYGMVLHNSSVLAAHGVQNAEDDEKHHFWDWLVCDEGHKLKNPKTQLVEKLQEIRRRRMLLLSGTPIQNNLSELWALFNLVAPGLLGDAWDFKQEYEKVITRGRSRDASQRSRVLGEAARQKLLQLTARHYLHRDKATTLRVRGEATVDKPCGPKAESGEGATVGPSEAPPSAPPTMGRKNDLVVWLPLTAAQRQLYVAFCSDPGVRRALNKTGSQLSALTVLKKLCDHPGLVPKADLQEAEHAARECLPRQSDVDRPETSCKIVFIMALLKDLQGAGHRTLVFSQSQKMLDMIEELARGQGVPLCRIDGRLDAEERHAQVDKFQRSSSIPLFLLSSQVGGLGLTLTKANRVIIVDPAWNPSTDNQSVDRAYRIGQERDVVIYRLISCGTVEEKIYRKQVFKGGLSRAGTEEANPTRYFTQEELSDLLRVDPGALDRSETQMLLHARHAAGRSASEELKAHLSFVHTLGISGISDHDLLYSTSEPKEIPKTALLGDEATCSRHQSSGAASSRAPSRPQRGGIHMGQASGVMAVKTQLQPNLVQPGRAERAVTPADRERLEAIAKVDELESELQKHRSFLSKNGALLARLPDGGEKAFHRLELLTTQLEEANEIVSAHKDRQDSDKGASQSVVPIEDVVSQLGGISL